MAFGEIGVNNMGGGEFNNPHQLGVHQTQKKKGFERWFTAVANTIASHEGERAFLDLLIAINDVAHHAFKAIQEYSTKIGKLLTDTLSVVSLFSVINVVQWWLYEKSTSVYETISMVFFTTLRGLRSALFIEELGAFNLSNLFSHIGKIPVIGLVLGGITGIALGTHSVHLYREYKKVKAEIAKFERLTGSNDDLAVKQHAKNVKQLKKIKMELAANAVNMVITALAIIGLCTGVGFLAMTGAFMLSLAVLSSVIWIYSCYRNERVKDEDLNEGRAASTSIDMRIELTSAPSAPPSDGLLEAALREPPAK